MSSPMQKDGEHHTVNKCLKQTSESKSNLI